MILGVVELNLQKKTKSRGVRMLLTGHEEGLSLFLLFEISNNFYFFSFLSFPITILK